MGGLGNGPPQNASDEQSTARFEPRLGLRYVPVEVPSGVRGRLAVIGRLIEQADAAIIMEDAEFGFGCGGCARTNEVVPYIVSIQGVPYIKVKRPSDYEATKSLVIEIRDFLAKVEGSSWSRWP